VSPNYLFSLLVPAVMSGPTATRVLRKKGYKTLVFGLTGNVLSEDVEFFKSMGADEVIGKPLKMAVLEKLWDKYKHCGRSHATDDPCTSAIR